MISLHCVAAYLAVRLAFEMSATPFVGERTLRCSPAAQEGKAPPPPKACATRVWLFLNATT